MASDLVERLRETLAGVETPVMRGDNLSILLASEFDNPDQPEGEHGWSEDAIKGADEILDAIHAHYATALAEQSRLNEEAEAEAYRRDVEDAAKVAEGVSTFEWRGGDEWAAGFCDGKQAAAAAIRALPADKEGA